MPDGFGIRIAISLTAGIELITPLGEDGFSPIAWNHLGQKGEGLFGIVYSVSSLTKGEACAALAGYPRQGERLNCFLANPAWRERYKTLIEAPLGTIQNVSITLIEAVPIAH